MLLSFYEVVLCTMYSQFIPNKSVLISQTNLLLPGLHLCTQVVAAHCEVCRKEAQHLEMKFVQVFQHHLNF